MEGNLYVPTIVERQTDRLPDKQTDRLTVSQLTVIKIHAQFSIFLYSIEVEQQHSGYHSWDFFCNPLQIEVFSARHVFLFRLSLVFLFFVFYVFYRLLSDTIHFKEIE